MTLKNETRLLSSRADFYFFTELNTRNQETYVWITDDGFVFMYVGHADSVFELRFVDHATGTELLAKDCQAHYDQLRASEKALKWMARLPENALLKILSGVMK